MEWLGNRYEAFRPRIGQEIRDASSGAIYLLDKVIGTSSKYNCVYRAEYCPEDKSGKGKNIVPIGTGFVTLRYVNASGEDQAEKITERRRIQSRNVIDLQGWFYYCKEKSATKLLVTLPYMSEGSLRYLLNKRFKNGLPEDCIAIALREALLGLKDFRDYSGGHETQTITAGEHTFITGERGIHRSFNAGDIFVNDNSSNSSVPSVSIKLAIRNARYESDLDYNLPPEEVPADESGDFFVCSSSVEPPTKIPEWVAPHETFDRESFGDPFVDLYRFTTKSDIWLVGITALELAYGDIRASNRVELLRMIKKIHKSKKLPDRLEDLLVKKRKMKKVTSFIKNKQKLGNNGKFSEEFEYVVLKCLEREESKRPTVDELLTFPFFQNAKGLNYFHQTVLHGNNAASTS